jgi:two-component system response regulator RegX3
MKVLLVENEPAFSEALSYMLGRDGFDVAVATTGQDAIHMFHRIAPDVILLDVLLPGMSGLDVCTAIRRTSDVPIIMVTARDSETDKVVGLEMGADDYITKPYSHAELLARMHAVMRRATPALADVNPRVLTEGPVGIDIDSHVVTLNGRPVPMALKEFELLEMLVRNSGRVMTRGQLYDRVWGTDRAWDNKTLDVHIRRLRAKIEPDPAHPRHLITIRGLGYRFDP